MRLLAPLGEILLDQAGLPAGQAGKGIAGPTAEEEADRDRFARFAPSTREEMKRVMQETAKARMPQTPEEETQFIESAKRSAGPAPVYEAILGPGNFYSERQQTASWQAAGYRDAESGAREILSAFRKALKS